LLTPECVDKTIDRDDPTRLEQKERQDRALLQATEGERPALIRYLERSEDPKVRHVTVVTRLSEAE